jgi:ATP-dependent protease ClpP protease subunit
MNSPKDINLNWCAKPRNRAEHKAATSFRLKHVEGARAADLLIYGEIGFWDVEALDVARAVEALDVDEITVRINSPGGDVFDGVAIYNLLKSHKAEITTVVDGVAASIASLIMLAGDVVEMSPSSMVMVHEAWMVAMGNKRELREASDLLAKIENSTIIPAYQERTGLTRDEIVAMVEATTWLSAEEAVEMKFADGIHGAEREETPAAAAEWDFAALGFGTVPKAIDDQRQAKAEAEAEAAAKMTILRRRFDLETATA